MTNIKTSCAPVTRFTRNPRDWYPHYQPFSCHNEITTRADKIMTLANGLIKFMEIRIRRAVRSRRKIMIFVVSALPFLFRVEDFATARQSPSALGLLDRWGRVGRS